MRGRRRRGAARATRSGGDARDDCPACGDCRKNVGDAVCAPCVLLVPDEVKAAWFRLKGAKSVWWLEKQAARNAVVEAAREALAQGRVSPAYALEDER